MHFRIRHRTRYRYPQPVFLEPHTVRLRPRCDGSQRVHGCRIDVDPAPAGRSEALDAEGNATLCLWFDQQIEELVVDAHSEVETLRHNPFDFLFTDADVATLPARYTPPLAALLAPALRSLGDRAVARFAHEVAQAEGNSNTLAFLGALTQRLSASCEVVIREFGEPYAPGQTLATQRGSCRDLTVLFIEACRSQGLAARFVSGYQEGDPDQQQRYLHAWPEVYLPGAGWRGYDPTLGLTVADRHVAVAASVDPSSAAPIEGTYRGAGDAFTLAFELEMHTSTAAASALPPGMQP